MKRYSGLSGFLLLLALCGCWSRPCRVAASIPAPPCKAEGTDSEGWRVATSICLNLEATGAEVQRAYVNGTHLSLRFAPGFGQQLLAEKSALYQGIEEFMSMMSKETGASRVSVEVSSGEIVIATGETMESGEKRITILK
jgi:hypothetical protein